MFASTTVAEKMSPELIATGFSKVQLVQHEQNNRSTSRIVAIRMKVYFIYYYLNLFYFKFKLQPLLYNPSPHIFTIFAFTTFSRVIFCTESEFDIHYAI